MQGRERSDGQLLDAGMLVGHLVRRELFAFWRRIARSCSMTRTSRTCSRQGRVAWWASVMASVMVLQVL